MHHCAHVLATGESDGYYRDYVADPIGLLGRALTHGFAYQGEPSPHREGRPYAARRAARLAADAFVNRSCRITIRSAIARSANG